MNRSWPQINVSDLYPKVLESDVQKALRALTHPSVVRMPSIVDALCAVIGSHWLQVEVYNAFKAALPAAMNDPGNAWQMMTIQERNGFIGRALAPAQASQDARWPVD